MANKELVALKEKMKAEHKARLDSIKQSDSYKGFVELQSMHEDNEETYLEVFKLSD